MQRHQRIVHFAANFQQRIAPLRDLFPFPLREINLVFNHPHHGLGGVQDVDAIQLMGEEGRGDALRQSQQRAGIGGRAVEGEQQHRIAAVKQRTACVGGFGQRLCIFLQQCAAQKKVPHALGDVGLIFLLRNIPRAGAEQPRLLQIAAQIGGLGFHNELRTCPVLLRYAVIIGHGFVHLPHFLIQRARFSVEHLQHRGGAEGEGTVGADGDGGPRHLAAGAAVQGTHTRDVVIGKKAQDEVAFAAQIAAILA